MQASHGGLKSASWESGFLLSQVPKCEGPGAPGYGFGLEPHALLVEGAKFYEGLQEITTGSGNG
jgi:hypothetical protein